MDFYLIAITIIIVLAIAYILSRPFTNAESLQGSSGYFDAYQAQYQSLLREIKNLENDCANGENDEGCHQIVIKKEQAAQLLRLINPSLNDQPFSSQPVNASSSADTKPEYALRHDGFYICPQCGDRVMSSDKFCTHCGHRLQP